LLPQSSYAMEMTLLLATLIFLNYNISCYLLLSLNEEKQNLLYGTSIRCNPSIKDANRNNNYFIIMKMLIKDV
jgi:hypothetical protein